ncbi:hypothetical protein AOQ84DRAFT_401722 [Glonium stellatum]|uniref:DUF676 domain-containing protein n=1 Tax=Glonium stellatum TaxID=574774 RepID=A0A8E2EN95_9PEZI|nr:hypothetical protein AOQ84DRAFT_401722 [Glonium stellatum]
MLLPSKVSNARVLAFKYDACVTDWRSMVSKNRIGNHSMNLLTSLATYREEDGTLIQPDDRPIIFVCHSLGGLVCEDALIAARQSSEARLRSILQHTRGIVFLGTPHHGAGFAKWAELLAKSIGLLKQTNPQIVAVLKNNSEVLARIQDGFHTIIRSRVVPSHSAILPGYIPIGIRANHMDMTKFESEDDPGFKAVAGEIRRWNGNLSLCQC